MCVPYTFCGTNNKGKMHLNITGLVKFDLQFVLSRVFDVLRQCGVYCNVRVVYALWNISCQVSLAPLGPTHPPFDGYRYFFSSPS